MMQFEGTVHRQDSARKFTPWMLKFLGGWLIVETTAFVVLGALTKLSLGQLWPPYLALATPGFIAGLIIFFAEGRKPEQPKSFALWFAVAVFVCLTLGLAASSYYCLELKLFRPDLMNTVLAVGLLGALAMSLSVYYTASRRFSKASAPRNTSE